MRQIIITDGEKQCCFIQASTIVCMKDFIKENLLLEKGYTNG